MKRKLLAILLSLAMLFTLLPPGAALAASPSYVALGDSITTGYGLSADNNVETNKSLSFAAQVATNNIFALNNLAEDGETSASLLDKLTKSDDPDYETVTEAVKSADVITITIGGNDLMDALYAYLAENKPELGKADEIANKLATGGFDTTALTSLIPLISQFGTSQELTDALSAFGISLQSIVNTIKECNPDVHIVVTTQYDPYSHIDTTNLGVFKETIDSVLAVFTNGVNALNEKINVQDASYKVADVHTAFENDTSGDPLRNAKFTSLQDYNLDFHPNAEGHKVIAGVVGEAVKGVTGVMVTPQQIVLAPGESANFSADVSTIGTNVNQAVTWTVSGKISNSTTIVDGKLTVAADETATTLTVTATSVDDKTKFGTATVTVGQKAEIYVGGVGLNGTAYATTDDKGNVSTDGANASNYNIKWDGATLTLNNATIKTGSQISEDAGMTAIYREASLDIVFQGANTVVSPAVGNEMSTSIYAGPADMQTATQSYGITISGDGSLDVSGSNAEDSSIGIGAMMGDVTIESGTVTAHGGATNGDNSAGIMTSAGDVIIHNGTVTATGGAAGDASAGIYAMLGDVTVSGGTVTATGGSASEASAGIYAMGMPEMPADGIPAMGGNVTISGGEVTAIAETGSAGITAMMMSQDPSAALGTVTISPAAGQQIAVRAGADETYATEIAGSPFTAATAIQSLIQNAAYVHTKAEQAPATEYTITFDANGGSVNPASAETTNGKLVSLPTPGYAGHIFQGWFTAATGGTQVTTDTVFTADATIYAQWKAESSTPSTPTGPGKPAEPDGPATEDSEGWSAIEDELALADDGDDIAVDMNGATEVPKEIFESVAGKSVEVSFDLEEGLSWTVNGTDIPTDADLNDLDLGVTMDSDGIPLNVINTITGERDSVQMTLAHDGEFGFTMTLSAPLGKENAGYWANLYHYDEDAEAMSFEVAAEIDDDGNVKLPMSHASQYAIVIDDHSHAAEEPADLPFTDVNDDDWFSDVVRYVYEQGLMTGTSDTEFSPNLTITRGMIVSILNRLEGGPTAEAAGFTDVADGDWYADAVNWAASEGIVAGYEDNTFRPNDPITREQLAAMLMNYAAWKGEDVNARADLSSYNDVASVSSWAAETVQWAVAEGLISGMPGNLMEPQGSATRAQVAAILERFLSE